MTSGFEVDGVRWWSSGARTSNLKKSGTSARGYGGTLSNRLRLPLEVFDSEVAALREGGVTFDTFDVPGLTWDGDIAVSNGGQGKAAWFRDPDGNTIGLTAGQMG